MNYEILLAIFFTISPITELRVGLPILVNYCLRNNLPIAPYFFLVILLNILVVFFIFFFLDFLHKKFLKISFYKKFYFKFLKIMRKKQEKFEERFYNFGYFVLIIFVAIPLPGTGVWTGSFLAWFFGLERKKSILAISLGVLIAGVIILFFSYNLLFLFFY